MAVGQEVNTIRLHWHVELKDLLLMFIFAEVVGMLGVFFRSHELPIRFPIFIGITAISRAIVLEDKDVTSGISLNYQAMAILLLSVAAWMVGKART